MPAIGIDIGTTHCRVGVWQDEKMKIIVDDQGKRQFPCYIAFTDTGRLIGKVAKNQVTSNPSNTIFDVKRLIGRKLDDENIQNAKEHWPFDLIDDSGKLKIQVKFRGKQKKFKPHEVTSMILKNVKEKAEAFLSEEVKDAVISVPACFSCSQRQETKDAAEAAGLNVLRIINEPSAAALAYGLDKNFRVNKYVVIFDLGASKLDVSIISIFNIGIITGFEVRSTAGSLHLGGQDFDSKLVEYFCEELKQKYKKDIKTDFCALKKLRIAAEKAKCTLSSSTQATIEINGLCDGIDFYTKITRAAFEHICADLFKSTLNFVDLALYNADLEKDSIHDIILVGGATHMPKLQSLLQDFFAVKKLNLSFNSYEAVACGAAVQAALLTDGCDENSEHRDVYLTDVLTSSLGIETLDGVMTPILLRNCHLPCTKTRKFNTSCRNQLGMTIRVFEGEGHLAEDNKFIGQFELEGITLVPSLVSMIDVTFDLDVNGTLHVTAKDAESNCNDNYLTLMNFHPCQNIEIEREAKNDCDDSLFPYEIFRIYKDM